MRSSRGTRAKEGDKPDRRLSVRGVRRDPPDLKRLSQALIALATAQLEAEARAEHEKKSSKRRGGADAA